MRSPVRALTEPEAGLRGRRGEDGSDLRWTFTQQVLVLVLISPPLGVQVGSPVSSSSGPPPSSSCSSSWGSGDRRRSRPGLPLRLALCGTGLFLVLVLVSVGSSESLAAGLMILVLVRFGTQCCSRAPPSDPSGRTVRHCSRSADEPAGTYRVKLGPGF